MTLVILYDHQENDFLERIDARPMDHEDNYVHYWAMREGNPFLNRDVLWIDRRYDNSRLFYNILECVPTNIDHMYVWIEDQIFPELNGWLTDTSENFSLTEEQYDFLNELTVDDVFLAVEM